MEVNLADSAQNQILLLAPSLLGESLRIQLTNNIPNLAIFLKPEKLTRHPCLVIWSIETLESLKSLEIEIHRLEDKWEPSPILILLPSKTRLTTDQLLQLNCAGIIQSPDLETLINAIKTLRNGGRVVKLLPQSSSTKITTNEVPLGLFQWLLESGIQQINDELRLLTSLLTKSSEATFIRIILKGRLRELNSAKRLLLWIWSPIRSSLGSKIQIAEQAQNSKISPTENYEPNINLRERSAIAVWESINKHLKKTIEDGITNSTGNLLAIEGLKPEHRKELMLNLIYQLDNLISKLRKTDQTSEELIQSWESNELELRQQSLRSLAGNYIRIPLKGELKPVADQLLIYTDLSQADEEIPDPSQMLNALLFYKPVEVGGKILPADDPRALIYLEDLVGNWLVRTAELISAEILSICGAWPELRNFLLSPGLISTRELERLRNQLNSQSRWCELIQRPIQLYESKRLLYKLQKGSIETYLLTEPRDEELRQLNWAQQQVALLVEARDALAPQLQALLRRIGDLMVVILTQVIGRSIGLIGRGIAQGMGRSLGRS